MSRALTIRRRAPPLFVLARLIVAGACNQRATLNRNYLRLRLRTDYVVLRCYVLSSLQCSVEDNEGVMRRANWLGAVRRSAPLFFAVIVASCGADNSDGIATKCLPKEEVQICYPQTWSFSEANGDLYVESPKRDKPPPIYSYIVISEKASQDNAVTSEALGNFFYSPQSFAMLRAAGATVDFSIPKNSNRRYGSMTVSIPKGQPDWFTNGKGENHIGYLFKRIDTLFPTKRGFVAITCAVDSEDRISPADQMEFVDSLSNACKTLISKADAG